MNANVNLRDNDQNKLTEYVESSIGDPQENTEAGWEAVKMFLFWTETCKFQLDKNYVGHADNSRKCCRVF